MKETRYFIKKEKGAKFLGSSFKTREEAQENLNRFSDAYKKHGWINPIIVKLRVEKPKPLTQKEKDNLENLSNLLNKLNGAMSKQLI